MRTEEKAEIAKAHGEPCARCGYKAGAHFFGKRQFTTRRVCSEWVDAAELAEDNSRADELWFFDHDGKGY